MPTETASVSVTGSYGRLRVGLRDKTPQPVTRIEGVQDGLYQAKGVLFSSQVTGIEKEPVSYVREEDTRVASQGVKTTRNPVTTRNLASSTRAWENTTRNSALQPVTGPHLITVIAHAEQLLSSNPDIYPALQYNASIATHARALTDAAHAGEDIPTLTELAETLTRTLQRVRESSSSSGDKFTRPRPKKDPRLNATPRTAAKSRTEAPPMLNATGTAAPKKSAPKRAVRINLEALKDQLIEELTSTKDPTGMILHAQTCPSAALHWINGDPYTASFPTAYQQERLAKTCAYLKTLKGAPQEDVQVARDCMAQAVHDLWPAYVTECSTLPPEGSQDGGQDYRAWKITEQLDSLWAGPFDVPLEAPAPYLPEFRDTDCGRLSYSWHLTLIALVYLNRQLGRKLLDVSRGDA